MFKALLLEKTEAGFRAAVRERRRIAPLPDGDVTGRASSIRRSTTRTALAITNKAPVVRSWPMVAGIDGAGTVLESTPRRTGRPGDRVVLNGWGVGETRWGCLAERARLKGDWLVRAAGGVRRRARRWRIGTAGYTAMLCVLALERHGLAPGGGEVLVTGATGGVGSVAIALLARLGHAVVARDRQGGRGRLPDARSARADVIDRAELAAPGKPLQKERWAAVVDAVGSHTLANALAQTRYGGVGRRLRPGAGRRPARHGDAVHPARRHAGRHRQRDGADRAPRARRGSRLARDLDPATARSDHRGGAARRRDREGRRADAGQACAAGSSSIAIASARRAPRVSGPAARTLPERRVLAGARATRRATISVVTTSAPSVRARAVAASRS